MSTYNPQKHHRRSIRLTGYDYRQPGGYFVTLCTHKREFLFGEVVDAAMILNTYGQIVHEEWVKSSQIRREIVLDTFVVMPNHMHAIVWIVTNNDDAAASGGLNDGWAHSHAPLQEETSSPVFPAKSLGNCINGFKSTVTKQINQLRTMPGVPVWQRNYYEHIIRNSHALHAIQEYIQQNPLRWHWDRYNPQFTERDPHANVLWKLLQG